MPFACNVIGVSTPLSNYTKRSIDLGEHQEDVQKRSRHVGPSPMSGDMPGGLHCNAQWLAGPLQLTVTADCPNAYRSKEAWLDPMMCMTDFSVAEIVRCNHELGSSCMECAGRAVHNVPLPVYDAWCQASCQGKHCRLPDNSEPSSAGIAYPGILSLATFLGVQASDQILHVNSGNAGIPMAWAMLLPGLKISCLERSATQHFAAVAAVSQLHEAVQARIRLHHCDPLSGRDDWCQANLILVNVDALDDSLICIVGGLQAVRPGTRIVMIYLNRSLVTPMPMSNFAIIHQAGYRQMNDSNNIRVIVYVKF